MIGGLAASGKLILIDARPPRQLFGPEQQQEALEKLQRKAGAATAGIEAAVAEAFCALRAELNEMAGGEASATVMVMARNAELTQLAAELQASISKGSFGVYVDEPDNGQLEKGLQRLAGICAVANDLLLKAKETALAEGKAKKGSATEQLFARIGASSGSAPVSPPGVPSSRVPEEQNHTPPEPPFPGGAK